MKKNLSSFINSTLIILRLNNSLTHRQKKRGEARFS